MADAAVFSNTATPAPQNANLAVLPNPGTRSSASTAMLPRLELMRACYGGTETMRQMGRVFLPQFLRESNHRYNDRLSQTYALNKLREAVDSASAKPFRNLLKLVNADQDLEDWTWNADGCGHHLHIVAHRFFNECVLTGLSHILVSHPTTTNFPNLAAQKAANPQPFFRLVRPEDLLACYTDTIAGESAVVHARISTSRTTFDRTSMAEIVMDQIYVIEPHVVQLWERPRDNLNQAPAMLGPGGSLITAQPMPVRYMPTPMNGSNGGGWRMVSEVLHDLDRVPLVTAVAGEEEAAYQVRPIFQDLAYKQVEHWVSTSEQRNILSSARFPMLAVSGVQVDENGPEGQGFEIGPWKLLTVPDPQGRFYYVEPKGHAIQSGADDIKNIEVQMDMLALNPVQSTNRQYVPQNERSIAETRVNSVVHDIAIGAKDALEKGIGYIGMWTGKDYSKAGVRMNFNFSGTDELAKKIESVLNSVKDGVLSREGALNELVRLNLFDEDFDVKAELARDTATSELQMQQTISMQQQQQTPPKEARDFPNGQTRPTKET